MSCPVCEGTLEPFFTKDFGGEWGLSQVDYVRCANCGLALSATHFALSAEEWSDVNGSYHSMYQGTHHSPDDPRWLARLDTQSQTLLDMSRAGLLPQGPWIDYGCGDGKLADKLGELGLPTLKFDRYMSAGADYVGEEALERRYPLVMNTSVLEHVRARSELDEVANLVADDGVFAFHTLVCEAVPRDPSWFYLLPVHTLFFSNRSMELLLEQWGFVASIYHVPAQMWFAYRHDDPKLEAFVRERQAAGDEGYHYKRGFVDYWKGEPYRAES